METLEMRKKKQNIKGCTYKITNISDGNYPRVQKLVLYINA